MRNDRNRSDKFQNHDSNKSKKYRPNAHTDQDTYKVGDLKQNGRQTAETVRSGRNQKNFPKPGDSRERGSWNSNKKDPKNEKRRDERNFDHQNRGQRPNEYNMNDRPNHHHNQHSDSYRTNYRHDEYNFEYGRSPMNRGKDVSSTLNRDDKSAYYKDDNYEYGRSPMNRGKADSSTLYRDDKGSFYKDDNGRAIRGAEAQSTNRDEWGSENYSDYNDDTFDEDMSDRGREEEYSEYEGRGAGKTRGRPIRESSRNHNRYQPGSKPYGSTQGRR